MAQLAIAGGIPVTQLQPPAWPIHGAEERRRILKVLESGAWSWMGEMETSFNETWAAFNGSRHSLLVANGTVALQLAYEALDVGRGDEVLVPGSTWQATAAAVLDVNAVPVLVDIDPETWCIDPKAAEAAITSRTKAIAAVHLYGCMTDMDALLDLARRNGLHVVEDCAHQHGAQWRGRSAGTMGDVGTFSFQQSKVLTCGEGGAILVQDDRLFGRLDQLRNCGRFSPHLPESQQGFLQSGNYRISEWQAAILLSQLERLPEQLDRREACAQRLNRLLAEAPGVRPMKRLEGVTRQSYYSYAFRFVPEEWNGIGRDAFCRALAAETGLIPGGGYEPLNHTSIYQPRTKRRHRLDDDYWARINPERYDLPRTERMACQEGVVIHHPFLLLDPEDMEAVGEAISKLHRNQDELRAARAD
jgi:L-glutamine:2-deoxy-scyllo-inosose/3-amino-2,3-dideoxy-scyllo-inosose aminotransferase